MAYPFQLRRFLSHKPLTVSEMSFVPSKVYNEADNEIRMDILKAYQRPQGPGDMLVIIPFFNPCNSVRMTQNALLIKSKLEQACIPFVIVHCLFPQSAPIANIDDINYLTVHSTSYAFIKENLANIAFQKHDNYAKYLVIDSDIVFKESDWYDNLCQLLDKYDVIQPYSTFSNLQIDFKNIIKSGYSFFKAEEKPMAESAVSGERVKGHTGYGIAFTRQFLTLHPYPDINLLGGGDTMICSLIVKRELGQHSGSRQYTYIYNKYLQKDLHISYKAARGHIYHLYHNDEHNRQYSTRYTILNKYLKDTETIDDIIEKNEEGVYEWKEDIRDEINIDVLNYFASRQDDDIYKA